MYLVKTPGLVSQLLPQYLWKGDTRNKTIYLTFDDGPIPEVTPWVLEQLEKYNAKASFFCVGDNVRKYPEIYNSVIEQGHIVGNHTFNHLNGWENNDEQYLKNIERTSHFVKSDLFRPPYGKISRSQTRSVKDKYTIVMWDILTGDFDQGLSKEDCLEKALRKTEAGSIVVFHDSIKSWSKMSYVLPRMLKHFSDLGYRFDSLHEWSKLQPESRMALTA
jgi:peptidoglycan/xylan/chitin deacetylase (PgdA/CDA1 family)